MNTEAMKIKLITKTGTGPLKYKKNPNKILKLMESISRLTMLKFYNNMDRNNFKILVSVSAQF